MTAIELSGVVKRFGEITAVDGLDLDVPEGICLGLLGPNGAGKSTTMRLLTGRPSPTRAPSACSGTSCRASRRTRARRRAAARQPRRRRDRRRQPRGVRAALRVKDVGEAVDRGLALARLTGRRQDAVDKLSGGMRRRLLLARGLVHRPRLMLLDEPTVGLDPQIRTELWSLIDGLCEGKTILMSTHYIEEAQRLADEVAVVAHGKVVDQAERADREARRARDGRGLRAAKAPGRGTRGGARPEPQGAPRGPGDRDRRVGARRRRVPEDAVRRAALEDVFVLLTGEEAE